MIYGNSTATFSSNLGKTTRLLRPRGRKFARARLSRSPGYLYVIRGDLQPSPAAFIAIIAPEVEVRDPRQPGCTRAFLSRFKRKRIANGRNLFAVWRAHVAFLHAYIPAIFYLRKSFLRRDEKLRRFIRILLFVEGVVSLVRGLILERRWIETCGWIGMLNIEMWLFVYEYLAYNLSGYLYLSALDGSYNLREELSLLWKKPCKINN